MLENNIIDLPFSDEPFDEEQAKAQEKWLEENHDRILENQRENYDEYISRKNKY